MTGWDVAEWGPVVCSAVMWIACGFALAEAVVMGMGGPLDDVRERRRRDAHRLRFLRELRRSRRWTCWLAAAQVAALGAAVLFDGLHMLAGLASVYLCFALMFPVLWAMGRVWAAESGIPVQRKRLPRRARAAIMAGLTLAGVGVSVLVVILIPVQVGDTIRHMRAGAPSDAAVGLVVIWLIFNAPWQEELVFRHYLVPRLMSANAGRVPHLSPAYSVSRMRAVTAVVLVALIFALGHAAHMEPGWPKLAQTFIWGLMLGGLRVWLGTWYAVGLHLLFNLSAPVVAPFLMTGG